MIYTIKLTKTSFTSYIYLNFFACVENTWLTVNFKYRIPHYLGQLLCCTVYPQSLLIQELTHHFVPFDLHLPIPSTLTPGNHHFTISLVFSMISLFFGVIFLKKIPHKNVSVRLQVEYIWGPFIFVYLDVRLSSHIGEVFGHYVFKYTSCSTLTPLGCL